MSSKPITDTTLFCGDNLPILREHIPTECVDLVYLDPPFNPNGSYNVLLRARLFRGGISTGHQEHYGRELDLAPDSSIGLMAAQR